MTRQRAAFTFIDVMVTLTVIAVLMTVVVPQMTDNTQLRLDAASRIMQSDLEMAQMLSVSNPAAPLKVNFLPAGCDEGCDSYELVYAAGGPFQTRDGPYAVTFGQGRASTARGVTYQIMGAPGADSVAFNGLGGLDEPASTVTIQLRLGGRCAKIRISNTTGVVREVECQAKSDFKGGL